MNPDDRTGGYCVVAPWGYCEVCHEPFYFVRHLFRFLCGCGNDDGSPRKPKKPRPPRKPQKRLPAGPPNTKLESWDNCPWKPAKEPA